MSTLNATERGTTKNHLLRKQGQVPAVMYGRKTESKALAVELKSFKKMWREAGESSVFTLSDGTEEHDALIHDVQVDPVTDEPVHVDFYIVEKGQTLTVSVPLSFEGESPLEDQGLQIVHVMHELEVEAKSKDLPHEITVDISVLKNADSQICVKDVKLPSGVVATADPDEVIVIVAAPTEEMEDAGPELDLGAIEVEKKGKDEEAQEA